MLFTRWLRTKNIGIRTSGWPLALDGERQVLKMRIRLP